MKPSFLVIGSGKSGTTTLCALLGSHPDVLMSKTKELNFFSDNEVYRRGFQWYESNFESTAGESARGEGSPCYTFRKVFPHAAQRIVEYLPDARLIYIVRNPLDRIPAAWTEMMSWGVDAVHHSFDKAVRLSRDWLVDSSNYWQEIGVYRGLFADEQILVLFYDDFRDHRTAALRRTFEFLGVDADVPIDTSIALNRSADKVIPRRGVSAVRSIPGVRTLWHLGKRAVPIPVRTRIRDRWLKRSARSAPQWSDSVREWVVDQLRDDTRRFLEQYGKPPDFWNLDR